jgi:hypothetical protein
VSGKRITVNRNDLRAGARRRLHGWRALLAATAVSLATGGVALAVQTPAKPGTPELRDPTVAASVPNISGTWYTRGFNPRTKPDDGTETPWLPWSKSEYDKREKSRVGGAPMVDPTAACLPSGNPRIIAAPYPIQIVQTPDMVVFLYEVQHLFRVIYLNAKHPAKVTPSFMGHSVGHWEGDTLVIDTVGLTNLTQIDENGTLHSDNLRVVERIRRTNENTLEDRFTIYDDKTFTKPWTAVRNFNFQPELRFLEYVCEENNRNAPDENGVLRNF